MGISTIEQTKKEELVKYAIEALIDNDEENTSILVEIKVLLNSIFGEENNQIQKGEKPKSGVIWTEEKIREKLAASNYSDATYRMYNANTLFRNSFGSVQVNTAKHKVYIRFPEVNISNGKDVHTLTDLWVHFCIDSKGRVHDALQGARSSATAEEFLSGYKHSHLNGGYHNVAFSYFCLGSGPLSNLVNIVGDKYDKSIFQMFLLNIKTYVAWESIAGTPYIQLASIRNRRGYVDMNIKSIGGTRIARYLEGCHAFMESRDLSSDIELKLEGGRFVAKISDALEVAIANYFMKPDISSRLIDLFNFFCYKNTDGTYVSGASVDVVIPKHQPLLEFKGEKIYLTISNKVQNVTEKQKYLHPIFKYQLESWLSNYFNTNCPKA